MIHFIRHGQTDANLNRINAGGDHDIPLNATGIAQARAYAAANQDFIESLDAVYVSPMIRTRQTMELVLGHHKKPVEVIEDLREIRLGQWSEMHHDLTGNYFSEQRDPPGGETWPDFHKRTIDALRRAAKGHPGRILVVAHGGIWFSYALQTGHDMLHIDNCGCQPICRIRLGEI